MDAEVVYGAIGTIFTVGAAIVGVAVYANTTRKMADDHDHDIRNLQHWRLNILPADLNANFARKGEMASELKAIHESLARIEGHQQMMAQRFMGGSV